MTTTKPCLNKLIVALLGTAALGVSAQTQSIIYDNATTSLGTAPFSLSGSEYGDQINFAGTSRLVTDFKFQYYLSAGSGTADLKIYDMTGNGAAVLPGPVPSAPGNLLYDSTVIPISSGNNTFDVSLGTAGGFTVPNSVTWTVTFAGTGTNHVGLELYDPPTVGSSLNDFWVHNSDGTWTISNFGAGGPVANFAAQVTAVPEPSVMQFGMLSGLVGFGMLFLRRRAAK